MFDNEFSLTWMLRFILMIEFCRSCSSLSNARLAHPPQSVHFISVKCFSSTLSVKRVQCCSFNIMRVVCSLFSPVAAFRALAPLRICVTVKSVRMKQAAALTENGTNTLFDSYNTQINKAGFLVIICKGVRKLLSYDSNITALVFVRKVFLINRNKTQTLQTP